MDVWRERLVETLGKAERLASLYEEAMSGKGRKEWTRNYYKYARKEAREASKILGVLEIELGAAMAREVERARLVYTKLAHAGSPSSEGDQNDHSR